VATGGDQDHVASVVQMKERVARLRSNAMHVSAKIKGHQVISAQSSKEFKAIRQSLKIYTKKHSKTSSFM